MDDNTTTYDYDHPNYEDRYVNEIEDRLYEESLRQQYGGTYNNPYGYGYDDYRSETW